MLNFKTKYCWRIKAPCPYTAHRIHIQTLTHISTFYKRGDHYQHTIYISIETINANTLKHAMFFVSVNFNWNSVKPVTKRFAELNWQWAVYSYSLVWIFFIRSILLNGVHIQARDTELTKLPLPYRRVCMCVFMFVYEMN